MNKRTFGIVLAMVVVVAGYGTFIGCKKKSSSKSGAATSTTLTVNIIGDNPQLGVGGSVSSSPAGISCEGLVMGGISCEYAYPVGTVVSITATSYGPAQFCEWLDTSSICQSKMSNPCVATIKAPLIGQSGLSLSAMFELSGGCP